MSYIELRKLVRYLWLRILLEHEMPHKFWPFLAVLVPNFKIASSGYPQPLSIILPWCVCLQAHTTWFGLKSRSWPFHGGSC